MVFFPKKGCNWKALTSHSFLLKTLHYITWVLLINKESWHEKRIILVQYLVPQKATKELSKVKVKMYVRFISQSSQTCTSRGTFRKYLLPPQVACQRNHELQTLVLSQPFHIGLLMIGNLITIINPNINILLSQKLYIFIHILRKSMVLKFHLSLWASSQFFFSF